MSYPEIKGIRKRLSINVLISWLVPWLLYLLLQNFLTNDTVILALIGIIPTVRTIAVLIWRRRVEWISLGGTLSFAVAFAASLLFGGSSLPLKLYHPVITGTIGLAFLISTIIRKPLLLTLIQAFQHKFPVGLSRSIADKQSALKRFTFVTAVVGLVLLFDAVAHIIMAFNLPTATYLILSRVVSIVVIATLVGVRWFIQRQRQF